MLMVPSVVIVGGYWECVDLSDGRPYIDMLNFYVLGIDDWVRRFLFPRNVIPVRISNKALKEIDFLALYHRTDSLLLSKCCSICS